MAAIKIVTRGFPEHLSDNGEIPCLLKSACGSLLLRVFWMRIYRYGLKELKACNDLSDVARLLDVQPKFLAKQIYHVDDSDKYHQFNIPKKNGSKRQINSPNSNLKFIQSRLSRLLYQCYFDLHGKPEKPLRFFHTDFSEIVISLFLRMRKDIRTRDMSSTLILLISFRASTSVESGGTS